jgi:nitrogen fixation protein FixH
MTQNAYVASFMFNKARNVKAKAKNFGLKAKD